MNGVTRSQLDTVPAVMLSPKAKKFVAVMVGTCATVTAKVQAAVRRLASRAVQLTCVVPIGNWVPLERSQLLLTGEVPPLICGPSKFATTELPDPVGIITVTGAGQLIVSSGVDGFAGLSPHAAQRMTASSSGASPGDRCRPPLATSGLPA